MLLLTKDKIGTEYQLAYVKDGLSELFAKCFFNEKDASLFAIACCRESGRYAVNNAEVLDALEEYFVGYIDQYELNRIFDEKLSRQTNYLDPLVAIINRRSYLHVTSQVCRYLARHSFDNEIRATRNFARNNLRISQILYWQIFQWGIISKHCTSDVRALAKGIYAEKAWDRMPILADALQDSGYDDEEALGRLRDPKAIFHRGESIIDRILSYCEK